MNYKRHKLLKHLAFRNIEYWQKQKGFTNPYMTFNEICEKLKWNKTELDIIYIQLESQLELEQSVENMNNVLTITEKGILSYSNGKYFNTHTKSIILALKDFAQIFIPVASLGIALMALNIKTNTKEDKTYIIEIKTIENKLDSLKLQMTKIEKGITPLQKNNLNEK